MSPGFCLLLFSHSTVSNSLQPYEPAAHQASLSFTISQSFLKLMSIESMMPSNQLIFRLPLLFLPSIFPSIRVFFRVCCSNQMAKVNWSFSICPSSEYPELISFRIDWFDPVFSSTTIQNHQFLGTQASLCSDFHTCT